MADSKITALTSISTSTDPANDPLVIVDVSDTSMAATGTTKKVTLNQLLGASGTATLASATITGDMTVDTSTLKVDSANNRVGIGTATPGVRFDILSDNNTSLAAVLRVNSNNAAVNTSLAYDGLVGSGAMTLQCGVAPFIVNTNGANERYRIASDGVATWSNVGGVAGTAMTLNATGLGVGVASPSFKLDVQSSTATFQLKSTTGTNAAYLFTNNTGGDFYFGRDNSTGATFGSGTGYSAILYSAGAYPMAFFTNAIERMRIDSSGNVGIGVTPSAWYSTYKAFQIGAGGSVAYTTDTTGYSFLLNNAYYNGTNWLRLTGTAGTPVAATAYSQNQGQHQWLYAGTGTAASTITWTTGMTLDASGNLLVGKTSSANSSPGAKIYTDGTDGGRVYLTRQSGSASQTNVAFFETGGSAVGSITTTNVATTYNTSSDYRLKESVLPLSGGLDRVNALKPSIYKWKSDGSNGEGFIAHELAEVVPFAVTGEKDAVNADGTIKSQGIDMSRVVPILVAAIQELAAEVNALKNA